MEIGSKTETGGRLLARNTALNFSGLVTPLLVAVIAIPYIIAKLGTDEFGILSLAWMVLGYFSFFDLGLGRATVKYVSEFAGSEKAPLIPSLVWTSIWIQVALGCVVTLVSASLIPFAVAKVLKVPIALVSDATHAFLLLAVFLPILLAGNTFRGVLEAAQRFDLMNYIRIPSGTLTVLLAAIGAGCGLRVTGIMLLILPARSIAAIAYMALSFRVFPLLKTRLRFDPSVVRQLSTFGGWVLVSNMAAPVIAYLERLLIASLLSVGALAFYAAPGDLVGRLAVIPLSMTIALFPFFSFHGLEGTGTISRVSSKSLKYLVLVIMPIAVGFVVYAHDILLLWLGPSFAQQSTVVLQVLAVSMFFNLLCYIPYNSIQALGRPDLKAWLDIVEIVFFAALAWVLIIRMGIEGAALARLAASLVDAVGLFWIAKSLDAFCFQDLLSGPLPRAFGLGAVLFASAFILKQTVTSLPINVALLACLFSVYGLGVWRLSMDTSEKVLVRELLLQLPIAGRKRMHFEH